MTTFKQCIWCGDIIAITYPKLYAYKYRSTKGHMQYFCSYGCMHNCKKMYPPRITQQGKERYPEPKGTWQREILMEEGKDKSDKE